MDAGQPASTRVLIERYLAAWQAGDGPGLTDVLHPEVEWSTPPSSGVGPFRGRDDVVQALTGGASGLIDLSTVRRTIDHVIVDGEHAAIAMSLSATTIGGLRYANRYVWWFTCRAGQIVRLVEHTDTLAAARTFGWVTDAIKS